MRCLQLTLPLLKGSHIPGVQRRAVLCIVECVGAGEAACSRLERGRLVASRHQLPQLAHLIGAGGSAAAQASAWH